MASKVIGFRVPEDIATQLEKTSEENGMTVAEFMRRLVDETLYPSTDNKGRENSDIVIAQQMQSLTHEQERFSNQVQNLADLIDNTVAKIETYETEGILGPKQVETMQDIESLKSKIDNFDYTYITISQAARNSKDILSSLFEYK